MPDFSSAQIACINHRMGPALVLAGPGSGKTTVITNRAVKLSEETKKPERILCVTFTRAAGEEMRRRYVRLCENTGLKTDKTPAFMTVHAFCNDCISRYEKKTGQKYERIEKEGVKEDILREIYRNINGNYPDETTSARLISYIQQEQSGGKSESAGSKQIRRFADILKSFREYKEARHLIDFEDMILMTLDIFEAHPDFCKMISDSYDYIQVDEAQDLSRAQYRVLMKIAVHGNIFVVADDDQSIYRFRGSDPTCLFDFAESFPGCVRYELGENYRSTKSIVGSAQKLISVNVKRFEKKLYTNNPEGCPVYIRHFTSAFDQSRFACDLIREGGAVLYRNSTSMILPTLYLTLKDVDYSVLGGNYTLDGNEMLGEALDEILRAERNARFLIPTPSQTFKKNVREGFIDEFIKKYEKTGEYRKNIRVLADFIDALTKACSSYGECVRTLDKMKRRAHYDSVLPGAPVLSTVHSAKGLEFGTVVLIDILKGEFPGSGTGPGEGLEEERRLFYVAMTRAAKELYVCYPEKRWINDEERSIFVEEISRKLVYNKEKTKESELKI